MRIHDDGGMLPDQGYGELQINLLLPASAAVGPSAHADKALVIRTQPGRIGRIQAGFRLLRLPVRDWPGNWPRPRRGPAALRLRGKRCMECSGGPGVRCGQRPGRGCGGTPRRLRTARARSRTPGDVWRAAGTCRRRLRLPRLACISGRLMRGILPAPSMGALLLRCLHTPPLRCLRALPAPSMGALPLRCLRTLPHPSLRVLAAPRMGALQLRRCRALLRRGGRLKPPAAVAAHSPAGAWPASSAGSAEKFRNRPFFMTMSTLLICSRFVRSHCIRGNL